jgi:hypothetical protein
MFALAKTAKGNNSYKKRMNLTGVSTVMGFKPINPVPESPF